MLSTSSVSSQKKRKGRSADQKKKRRKEKQHKEKRLVQTQEQKRGALKAMSDCRGPASNGCDVKQQKKTIQGRSVFSPYE